MLTNNGYGKFVPHLLLITGIFCVLALGFLCGSFYANAKDVPSYPIQFIDDINPYVPYIKILGIQDSTLQLETTDHTIRIENGEEILNAPANTAFAVPIQNIITPSAEANSSPTGTCNFVAAKTGKYLYPAESSQGQRLSSTKRCFANIADGEKAGLTLWQKK